MGFKFGMAENPRGNLNACYYAAFLCVSFLRQGFFCIALADLNLQYRPVWP